MNSVTFSVVVETENLAGGGIDDLRACLQSLVRQTVDVSSAEEVIILVGGHLDSESAAAVGREFPFARILKANDDLNYLGAKRLGAQSCSADVVVFADSDVTYAPEWLETLLGEMQARQDAAVVCSDTRLALRSSYDFAMQLVWMLPVMPSGGEVTAVAKFRLNNFAVRREWMFASHFDEDLPLYRGTIELWRQRLRLKGAIFYRVPVVQAWHLSPRTLREWWYRMLIFGADFVAASDYKQPTDGQVQHKPSFRGRALAAFRLLRTRTVQPFERFGLLIQERRSDWRWAAVGIPIAIVSVAVQLIGGTTAVLAPELPFRWITAFEND